MADPNPPVKITEQYHVENQARGAGHINDHLPRSGADTMPCGCHRMGSRNLIVCIDGSLNQFGDKNTNVIELYNLILKEDRDRQRTWYNSGTGTYAQPSSKFLSYYAKALFHTIDSAIAWDIERTVLGAYRWLSDNYKSGDCIFVFGFSRGAYQVRVLSAMIDKVGLIYKGNEMQIPFAYELYANSESSHATEDVTKVGHFTKQAATKPKGDGINGDSWKVWAGLWLATFYGLLWLKCGGIWKAWVGLWLVTLISWLCGLLWLKTPSRSMSPSANEPTSKTSKADRFKHVFSHKDVKVHFVGAWDTVSSIGIVRAKEMLPGTVDGMKNTCYFRHALALDERRIKFLPEYAYGGTALDPKLPAESGEETKAMIPHTKEVWFAGTHSDIGGGNISNPELDRTRPPLRWMVFEAGAVGLRTARFDRELSSHEQISVIESLKSFWWILEFLPLPRLTFATEEDGRDVTRKPHLGSGRKIHPGQKIDSSLLQTDKKRYTPKARPLKHDHDFWKAFLANDACRDKWLESDMYQYTASVVRNLITLKEGKDVELQRLHQIAVTVDGRQAIYDKVVETLQNKALAELKEEAVKDRFLRSIMEVFKKGSPDPSELKLKIDIRPLVSDLQESSHEHYRKIAEQFVMLFTPKIFRGHTGSVWCTGFSGNRVVSGSDDQTIRIWDLETGKQVLGPFIGHTAGVNAVSFSSDGKSVVSSLRDQTVWIWDVETKWQVAGPFKGHTGSIWSVALSRDGKRVVSGSDDRTVRIWDVKTGEQVISWSFEEHTGPVWSVAFSHDGECVVSGSDDSMVRILNMAGKVVRLFEGHTGRILSVSFSPDGKWVASGSEDHTIRIWNVQTGEQVGPLVGHTAKISSVAFSPDGKRVVSGSRDQTVRIWDAKTGEQVVEPFRGHTNWVRSVAFSSDGKWVVSGSIDQTVRIWVVSETRT